MYNSISNSVIIGKKVVFLPSCHSTNAIAAELVHSSVFENGTVVITNRQTHGRGQRGTIWTSGAGLNLTFSILLRPQNLAVSNQFLLSQSVACGILKYILSKNRDAYIKWPNDIYIGDKKVCGTLIENSIQGANIATSIVGVGLNVNQEVFEFPRTTSLSNVLGHTLDLETEFIELIKNIDYFLDLLFRKDYQQIHTVYLKYLLGLGQMRNFKIGTTIVQGEIVGISDWGKLRFQPATNNKIIEFDIKEIEWIW